MGSKKQEAQQQTTETTSTPIASAEEKRLRDLQMGQLEEYDPYQRRATTNGLDLIGRILSGQALPGNLGNLAGGISPEMTGEIAQQSVQDILPQFQQSGILDSGVAAEIAGRTAGDVRRQSAQFNVQNLMNLLGLGVQGATSLQQPALQTAGQLGQTLGGLRGTKSTSTTTFPQQQQTNPFLRGAGIAGGAVLGGFAGGPVGAQAGATIGGNIFR